MEGADERRNFKRATKSSANPSKGSTLHKLLASNPLKPQRALSTSPAKASTAER